MKQALVMATRCEGDEHEAEPVLVQQDDGLVVLTLDDGVEYWIPLNLIEDVLAPERRAA